MGLDQYWFVKKPEIEEKDAEEEIAYHRKFNALEGFMAQEAINLGIIDDSSEFNCVELPITQEILDRLKETIDSGSLTPTPGFFFGPLEVREEDVIYLKEVIELAERYLEEGVTVFYTSWW